MEHFTPTLYSKDTGKNVREFVKEHKDEVWKIFKPFMPFIVSLYFLDAMVNEYYYQGSEDKFEWGALLAKYFILCLTISWHRVVIRGLGNYKPMNPFKPQKHELMFLSVAIMLPVSMFAVFGGFIFLGTAMKFAGLAFIGIIGLLAMAYIAFRFSFYFPGKAVDGDITLKKAFGMTKGYFWKVFWAGISATIRLSLLAAILGAVLVMVFVFLGFAEVLTVDGHSSVLFSPMAEFVFYLPFSLYFDPLITVLTVSVLSNYYLYALRNPQEGAL